MLASELVSAGSFDVLSAMKLTPCWENRTWATRPHRPATKAKIGQIKGASTVAATVSAFEEETKGSGGGVRLGGISVGGKQDKAYIAIDLKIIDTTTGAIVDARTIEAEAKGQGLAAGLSYKSFSVNGDTYQRTPAGKAIRACVIYLSEYLDCSLAQGKDAGCMKKWNEMERKRRERTKGVIDIR
jgi:curli biogenesis system outer membrane secretion channel CsgG